MSRIIESEIAFIDQTIESAKTKIQFLHATPPIQGIVRASQNDGIDPYDGTTSRLWKQRLKTIFEAFLKHNNEVFQARIIGLAEDGLEVVRVERQHNDIVSIVDEKLQSKGHREYVKRIATQPQGQTYISGIELNREYGRVSQPETPTIRLGLPIYDQQQNIFGMIVLNIDATIMLQNIKSRLPQDLVVYLTNENGGYLIHPDKDKQFEYEYDKSVQWSSEFPELDWKSGSDDLVKISSAFDSNAYFFAYDRLRLSGHDRDLLLNIMVGLPYPTYQSIIFGQSTQSLIIGAAVLTIVIAFIIYYQYNVKQSLAFTEVQARFEAIVDGSVDAIIAMDVNGYVTSWNTSAHDLIGYSGRQAEDQLFVNLLFDVSDQGQINAAIEQIISAEYLDPIRVDVLRRNGNTFSSSIALSPIRSNAGVVVGVAAIVRDLTELESVRENEQVLEREVQQRTKELEKARNEALSASKAKSNFIANVSHEIRTPLGGIIGMLRLLRKQNTPETTQRYFEMAESSAQVLAKLINDVLDISKIEAGKLDVGSEHFNLLQVASSVISSLAISADEKSLELVLDAAGVEHLELVGDSTRLRQVITNLVGNAIKFTDHGWIKVTLATELQSNGKLVIKGQVQDTGLGIGDTALTTVFEAFTQGEEGALQMRGGTGLGLSITRQLCRLMGGDISVTSVKGQGSCFKFHMAMACQEQGTTAILSNVIDQKVFGILGLSDVLTEVLRHQLLSWGASSVEAIDQSDKSLAYKYDVVLCEPKMMPYNREFSAIAVLNQSAVVTLGSGVKPLIKPVLPLELYSVLVAMGVATTSAVPGLIGRVGDHNHSRMLALNADGLAAKILVVDDNATNRAVLEGLLEDYSVEVVLAEDGAAAIHCLRDTERGFDLVFMDCQMPVLDGYAATRKIRAGEAGTAAKLVPIVAVTAAAMAGDRERCNLAGMDDYITKPIEPDSLMRVLAQWLGDQKAPSEMPVESASHSALTAVSTDVWDAQKLLNKVNQREKHFHLVVNAFKESTPPKIEELKGAMAKLEHEAVALLAHTLKGAAASLCAPRFQKVIFNLERQARNDASSGWPDFITVIDTEFSMLLAELNQNTPTPQAPANTA